MVGAEFPFRLNHVFDESAGSLSSRAVVVNVAVGLTFARNSYTETVNCRLVSISGPWLGSEFVLRPEENFAGRDLSNTIQLVHRSVSRSHCVIRGKGEEWSVTDLESHNGTCVNGIPVQHRVLRHGDELQIGDYVFLFLTQPAFAQSETATTPVFQDATIERTIVLHPDESRYLVPGKVAAELVDDLTSRAARMAREMEMLLSISLSIQSLSSVEAIAHRLLESAMEMTAASLGAVYLRGQESDGDASSFAWRRGEGPIPAPARILAVIAGVKNDSAAAVCELSSAPGIMVATVPILSFGRSAGALAVESEDPGITITRDHLQLMSVIAALAGPALDHAAQLAALENENRRLRDDALADHGMVGESPAMQALLQRIARIAPTDSTVLILGESGVGKELVARALHCKSQRVGKEFVAINCATLSQTLLESELFGHERGAFTGAIAQKKGMLEVARGGTLFLDEVSEMTPALQAKLLRVLQEREFERVGGTRTLHCDARFIAATNRNLEQAVASGSFRSDLFYRLNVIQITLPPLRARREDIPLLANFFIARFARKTGRNVKGLSSAARGYLINYDWPGNVRELENAMERAVVLGSGVTVVAEDLPEALLEGPAPPGVVATRYHEALIETKRQLILSSLEKTGGSQLDAAKLLGLHPNYLSRLIRNLNMKSAVKEAGR